jgi:hypothetical protein
MNASLLPRNQIFQPHLPENATVKLIGLGGIGSILARYASLFLASLGRAGRLVLIDGDAFEPSNATRMFFGACGNKAAVVREELLPRLVDSNLTLVAVEEFLTADNITQLVHEGDILLLAVDNHATRKLVNDHCAQLENICLISGGNDGVGPDSAGTFRRGTYGGVQIYHRHQSQDATPALTYLHPEILKPVDHLPTDLSCTDLIASVPQILFTNLAVASAMLNALWLHLCGALHYSELALDIADGLMRPVLPIEQTTAPQAKVTAPAGD